MYARRVTEPDSIPLSRAYVAADGTPRIDRVDPSIFTQTYFARCMECTFCHDVCCAHGCDIDEQREKALLSRATELEAWLGIPRTEWFVGAREPDPDSPGGSYIATRVVNDRCVFLSKTGRGCRIHTFALERGLDYHEVKPLSCWLFPLLTRDGLLTTNRAMASYDELVCKGLGPTFYEAVRDELGHMFGPELKRELDGMAPRTSSVLRRLPLATP